MSGSSGISLRSCVRQSQGFLQAEVDGEIVAMSVEKGMCYGLDAIGTRVWRMLGDPTQVADICAALECEYRVAPEVCEKDVLDLLEELRSEGMIEETA